MISKKLRALDFYGTKVTLGYNGESKFQTCFGALLSLISIGLMGLYIFLIVTNPVKISETINTSNTTSKPKLCFLFSIIYIIHQLRILHLYILIILPF